jgi:hypothetical protein
VAKPIGGYPDTAPRMNLRRTIAPYVGQTLILAGTTVFLAYVAHKRSDWSLLWSSLVFWSGFAVYVYIALKYRILWNESGVFMRASGLGERQIPFKPHPETCCSVPALRTASCQRDSSSRVYSLRN